MRKWFYKHSLTLALTATYLSFQTVAALVAPNPFDAEYWQAMFQGHSDEVSGVFLLVVYRKFFWEKGSTSEDDPN